MSNPQNSSGPGGQQPGEPSPPQWQYLQQPQNPENPQYAQQPQYNPGGAYPPAAPPPGAQGSPQNYTYPAQYNYQPQYAVAPPRRGIPVWVWIVGGVAAVLLCACVASVVLLSIIGMNSTGSYYPGG